MEPTLANAQFSCLKHKAARLTRNVRYEKIHISYHIDSSNRSLVWLYFESAHWPLPSGQWKHDPHREKWIRDMVPQSGTTRATYVIGDSAR